MEKRLIHERLIKSESLKTSITDIKAANRPESNGKDLINTETSYSLGGDFSIVCRVLPRFATP